MRLCCLLSDSRSKLQGYVFHSNPVLSFHYIFIFHKILNTKVYWSLTDKLKITLKTNKQKQRLLESYDPYKSRRKQFEFKEWSWKHKILLKVECISLEADSNLSLSRMGTLCRFVTWVVYTAKLSLLIWIQECCKTIEWAHQQDKTQSLKYLFIHSMHLQLFQLFQFFLL